MNLKHPYPFDPSYGYDLERLLTVLPPPAPEGFAEFWQNRYQNILLFNPEFERQKTGTHAGFKVFDIRYRSTGDIQIGGWLLEPEHRAISQSIIVGHGYGGRDQPDYHFNIPETAFLFPCFRGISRSRCATISDQPYLHVLDGIEDPGRYVIGGCVDDLWLGVSVMLALYPDTACKIGYMGASLGGGIGALAVPWDQRIRRAHLNVPTFGHQALRLKLPTLGSGAAVTQYVQERGHIPLTLMYYDAAIAAGFAAQPVHIAAALFDPMVAPPGQFAVYNAWAGPKSLLVLDAGHFAYPRQDLQNQQLLDELRQFFQ